MGYGSAIEWTDHTFNPWHGCAKVSPGCAHCYAETLTKRWGGDVWGKTADRRFFGDKHWSEPRKWDRKAQQEGVRRRVFCGGSRESRVVGRRLAAQHLAGNLRRGSTTR